MNYYIGAWRWKNPDEVYHYGIKGMKWGIRRTPAQLGHKPYTDKPERAKIDSSVLRRAVRKGEVSLAIRKSKQSEHDRNSPLYKQGKSYTYFGADKAQRYILRLHGTGTLVSSKKGEWVKKERVRSDEPIGVYIDMDGVEHETYNALIIYSNKGTHIYPAREDVTS